MKLYLYAALAIAFAGLLWREHYLVGKVKRVSAELTVAEAKAARANKVIEAMKADATLNKETTYALAERLADIDRSRRTVSVLCRPAHPAVSAESRAAGGADAAASDGGARAALVDIGTVVEDVRIEAERNNARAVALQEWERRRAH